MRGEGNQENVEIQEKAKASVKTIFFRTNIYFFKTYLLCSLIPACQTG